MNEEDFTHLILTRNSYPKDFPNLEQRMWLLKEFTAQSIRSQENQNFRWVLSGEPIPGIDAEFTSDFSSVIAACPTPWVITTRLDNDDLLAPNFVQIVQSEAAKKTEVIDMAGWRLNTSTSEIIEFNMYHEKTSSPFASLVQPTTNAGKGVLAREHGSLSKDFSVRFLQKRGWVQIISPFNKSMKWDEEGHEVSSQTWLDPYLSLAKSQPWL